MLKSRWILQTLILSVGLNAVLISTFFYFIIRDNTLQFTYKPKEERYHTEPPLTATLLGRLHALTFDQLVELLSDQRKIEHGYQVCDCALGALAAFHDFDVERGLGKGSLSKRTWEFSGNCFLLFPGLEDADFEQLRRFAAQEKWPLTPKGLLKKIQQNGMDKSDPSLIHYFCHTTHFVLLETLFARTGLPLQKKMLLALAIESGWEGLDAFYQRQCMGSDFSSEVRQKFLVDALLKGSKSAAYLLLITDPSFASNQLDDTHVLKILTLLTVKTHEALEFAHKVANSPRGDTVREKAVEKVVFFTGKLPDDLTGHFYGKPGLKELRPLFRQQHPAAPDPRTHIIQPGESLWLISKKYQVPMEVLMQTNHLQSETIQPGKSLKIPPSL